MNSNSDHKARKISTCYEAVYGSIIQRKLTFSKLVSSGQWSLAEAQNRIEDGPRLDSETATRLGTIEVQLKGGTNRRKTTMDMPSISKAAIDTVDEKLKKVG